VSASSTHCARPRVDSVLSCPYTIFTLGEKILHHVRRAQSRKKRLAAMASIGIGTTSTTKASSPSTWTPTGPAAHREIEQALKVDVRGSRRGAH
jgi:hypothetical protein